jgi:tripartite-type tricarboxylate transporter receptor subunit TctC
MLSNRLRIGIASIVLAGGIMAAAPLLAEDYPTRPVTIIVASTAGGGNDIIARIKSSSASPSLSRICPAPAR